jgi:hypothetical protein
LEESINLEDVEGKIDQLNDILKAFNRVKEGMDKSFANISTTFGNLRTNFKETKKLND